MTGRAGRKLAQVVERASGGDLAASPGGAAQDAEGDEAESDAVADGAGEQHRRDGREGQEGREGRQNVARLRVLAARHPEDRALAGRVRELSARSPEFRRWRARYGVQDGSSGRKQFDRPVVGRRAPDREALPLPDAGDRPSLGHRPGARPGRRPARPHPGARAYGRRRPYAAGALRPPRPTPTGGRPCTRSGGVVSEPSRHTLLRPTARSRRPVG
ncbi:hypothetical protein ACIQ9P_33110 [Kitasatospora sp. NPDC094019]|uniref:MmyB family transcriptional regulator n=1 Tax=Kitasatospora sp. NPDC094019 TaxID=3364091 RepID=UPI003821EF73